MMVVSEKRRGKKGKERGGGITFKFNFLVLKEQEGAMKYNKPFQVSLLFLPLTQSS